MKRVWKPLDVGGLRLYQVVKRVLWRDGKITALTYLVMARSPKQAGKLMDEIYKEVEWAAGVMSVEFIGKPVDVLMPEAWWQDGVPRNIPKKEGRIMEPEIKCKEVEP